MKKLLIIHNIATSYYKNIVFNELYKKYEDFEVLHLAETERIREWKIDLSGINYPKKILFKGDLNKVPRIKLFFEIIKAIKNFNPDILYLGGYSDFAYWVSLFYGKLKGKKIIIEMNSTDYGMKKFRFKEWIKKLFIKQCDVGITYSDLSKNYLINLGMKKERIIIKPNVTNNKYWEEKSKELKSKIKGIQKEYKFKKKNFIYIGRFSTGKNLFFLLDAYKKAKIKIDDNEWGLILVGDGPQRNDLLTYVKDNKIKSVFFEGFVDKEKLPEYFSISDILVLPSIYEPWGIVVNEAMASGLAAFVSSRCGSAKELIKNGENGFIFDIMNKEGLSDLMIKTMQGKFNIEKMKISSQKIIQTFTHEYASGIIVKAVDIFNNKKRE